MSSSGTARRRSTSKVRSSSAKKSPSSAKRSSSRSSTRVSSLATQNDVQASTETRRRARGEDTPARATRAAKKQQQQSQGLSISFNSETATSVAAAAFLLAFVQVIVYSVFFDEVRDDVVCFFSFILSKSVGEDIINTIGNFYLHLLLPLPIYYFSALILIGDPKKATESAKALSRVVQLSVSLSYLLYAFITEGGDGDYFEDDVSRAFVFLSLVSSVSEFLLYRSEYTNAKLGHFASVVIVNLFFVFNEAEYGKEYFEQFLLAHALCLASSEVSSLLKNSLAYLGGGKPTFLVHVTPYVLGLFFIALILFGEFTTPTPLLAYVYAVVYIGFHGKDSKAFEDEQK